MERWIISLSKLQQFFYELHHVTAALLQTTVVSYYKLRQIYYKLEQNIITNYESALLEITVALLQITAKCYFKLRQLYYILRQCVITNCGSFIKLLQIMTGITNYDVISNYVVTRRKADVLELFFIN